MVIQQCGGECDGGHHRVHVQLRWDHSFISEPWCSAQMKASSSWKKPLSSGHKHFSTATNQLFITAILSSKRTEGPKPKHSLRGHGLEFFFFFLGTRYSPYSNTMSLHDMSSHVLMKINIRHSDIQFKNDKNPESTPLQLPVGSSQVFVSVTKT